MSDVDVNVYLFFPGNCKEAMEFYKSIFGGELTIQTMGEVPGEKPTELQGKDDLVMHASLRGDVNLMASDNTTGEKYSKSAVSISLGGTNEEKLRGYFDKLAIGGSDIHPLQKEFWGDTFGSLTDKFGIDWMVNITSTKE